MLHCAHSIFRIITEIEVRKAGPTISSNEASLAAGLLTALRFSFSFTSNMATNNVRMHTNKSNRATARDAKDRKVVYKSVLDNPFTVSWSVHCDARPADIE